MPNTPVLGLPFPAGTTAPDAPYDMEQLALGVEAAVASAWSSYTPTWGAGTAPSIGNGSLIGRTKQIGKTVFWLVRLTIGSTTNAGTGAWNFSLPANIQATIVGTPVGNAGAFDTSSSLAYAGVCVAIGANGFGVIDLGAAANARWAQGTPISVASGDVLSFGGTYESV